VDLLVILLGHPLPLHLLAPPVEKGPCQNKDGEHTCQDTDDNTCRHDIVVIPLLI